MKKFLRYIRQSAAMTFTGLIALNILAFGPNYVIQKAMAAPITNWTVHNEAQHRLDVNITPTQTTGIKISQGTRNGSAVNWITTTGGTIRIRRGFGSSFGEDIYYRTATIGSDGVATLNNVIRNVCRTIPDRIVSCGDGEQFYAGDIVELTVDARQLNWKLDKNRVNTLTESGAIRGTSTGTALIRLNSVTTAQRSGFTDGPANGDLIYNSTIGSPQFYAGGNWYAFGSGAGVTDATTTSKGVGEVATVSDLSGSIVTGDSGAPTWIGIDLVIRGSSGAVNNRNKVVATNNTGYLSGSLLPDLSDNITKFNGGTSASSSTYWRGDGTWVDPSTALSPLVYASSSGSINISGDTNEHDFTRSVSAPMSWTLTGSTVSTGTIIVIRASGQFSNPSGSANPVIRAKIGSTTIGAVTLGPPSTATYYFDIETTITVQAVGANGKTRASTRATGNLSTVVVMDSQHDSGINFTSNNVIKLSGQLTTASSNVVMLHGLQVYKYTPPYTN